MGYVPGWSRIEDLVDRLGDLEHAVGPGMVVPAQWEPYFLIENEVTFEVRHGPQLSVAGFRDPLRILGIIQKCYRAATERILHNLATRVIHTTV